MTKSLPGSEGRPTQAALKEAPRDQGSTCSQLLDGRCGVRLIGGAQLEDKTTVRGSREMT